MWAYINKSSHVNFCVNVVNGGNLITTYELEGKTQIPRTRDRFSFKFHVI